ncbi:adenylyltransferase/cytidyltransferase family protein [Streptomyces cyaneofuscatus]|uniref:adenylyltransferase/cytidyltransferase family protein n=1 Tax=Streptomyces cyaneofuscatus TaxID=66883 RepID=UPI0036BB0CC4
MRALFPGSFDPVAQGHQDILRRAALLFDEVVVCVMFSANKTGRFPVTDRLDQLRAAATELGNVTVGYHTGGLLVDYCSRAGIDVVIHGVRGVPDLEYENADGPHEPRTGWSRNGLHRCRPCPGSHLLHPRYRDELTGPAPRADRLPASGPGMSDPCATLGAWDSSTIL